MLTIRETDPPGHAGRVPNAPPAPAPVGPAAGGQATRRGGRAYLLAFLGRGLRAAGRISVLIAAARLLPVDEMGRFTFAVATGAVVGLAFDLGLTDFVVREVPAGRLPARALVAGAVRARAGSLVVAIACGWAAVVAAGFGQDGLAAAGAVAFGASGIAMDFLAAVHRAHGRHDREAIESGAAAFVPLAAALALLAAGITSAARFPEVLGGAALALALARLAATARGGRADRGSAELGIRRLVAASRWFLARALLTWALFESAPVVIGLLADETQVAWFAAATRPVGLLTLPIFALGSVFMPAMARDLASSRQAMDARTREVNQISLLLIPFCFAGCLLGGGALLDVFGEAYRAASTTLLFTAFAYSIYLGTFSVLPLVTLGRERIVALGQVAALAIFWTGMIALVPTWGATGAALALLLALGASKVMHLVFYRQLGLPSGGLRQAVGFAAALAWMVASALSPPPWSSALLVAGAAASLVLAARQIRGLVLVDGRPAPPPAS